ncbi:MAG TPA: TonB-dependent receptor [Vicinamibacterales bacterium]|jgi:outer membrane receptor protein involved in Fe transport|nr:TonB-dependent receptor [Vicinamibacterales bacterium]
MTRVLVLSCVLASMVSNLEAQTATGTLSGVIRDTTGAVMPGVAVTAKNAATGVSRTVASDAEGRYRIVNLEPGAYEVRAELAGFRTAATRGVAVLVGGTTELDLTMSVGQLAEEVTVATEPQLIELSKTELSRVVSSEEIESLPISGRNFVDFVKLSSGVTLGRENVGGGAFKEPDVGVGSAAAPRLSFGGQPELNTQIQVDGADNVQTFTGLPRATPSQEAAREFRVLNSTYLAEYGRALGGFVNIVTKSGTNRRSGSAYYFGMSDAFAARSILNRPGEDELGQHQFGGTFGGPITPDRTFFFANYEGQIREQSNRFSQVVLDNLVLLNAVRVPLGLRAETTDQVLDNAYHSFLVKADHHPSGNHTLSVRYNFLDSDTENFLGGGGRASPTSSTARDNETRDQALVASVVSVLSATLVNEGRFQFARRTFDFSARFNEPSLDVSNFIIMGKSTSDVDYYAETRVQLADSVTWTTGAHQVKGGIDINILGNDSVWNLFFPARIVFPNLAAFQTFSPVVFWWPFLATATSYPGISTSWTQAVPSDWVDETEFSFDHSSYGFFVQDQWKASERLTVSYGIRYDLENYPSRYVSEGDYNNFQPRAGAAYAYSDRGVVRAGWGIFHDRLASSIGQLFNATEWSSGGNLANSQALFPTIAPIQGRFEQRTVGGPAARPAALAFLANGTVPAAGTKGLADTIDGALDTPYSHQASVQISQEVGPGWALSASYLYVGARDLIGHTGNLNAVQTGTLPTGKPIIGGRMFPEVGAIFVQTNTGESSHHGGTFEVQRRLADGYSLHGSYTISRTRTNVDSLANLSDIPEYLDVDAERGPSRQDVTHRFTLSALSQLSDTLPVVGRIRLSGVVTIESGRHYNIFIGGDSNADGNPNTDRPCCVGRNSYEGPGYASVDVRVAREFALNDRARLDVSLDLFNLFNRDNVKDVNTVWGGIDINVPPAPQFGFGTARDMFNPFQAQIGLKLKF